MYTYKFVYVDYRHHHHLLVIPKDGNWNCERFVYALFIAAEVCEHEITRLRVAV